MQEIISNLVKVMTLYLALCLATDEQDEKKNGLKMVAKKKKQKTGYRTSAQIEKAPSEDHPCNLTR